MVSEGQMVKMDALVLMVLKVFKVFRAPKEYKDHQVNYSKYKFKINNKVNN
jgi:hypothetical protein